MNKHLLSNKLIVIITFCLFFYPNFLKADENYTIMNVVDTINKETNIINHKESIIPSIFVGYGIMSLINNNIRSIDYTISNYRNSNFYDFHNNLDDFTQFAPIVSIYILNTFNIKGEHHWVNSSIIYATSMAMVTGIVTAIKYTTLRKRPDGSTNNSFPSGHTATAFASAELLRKEYKDISPWIGLAGYVVATSVGVMRILNNRHYMSDVIAGAGIGILSTNLSYYIYNNLIRPKGWDFSVSPTYNVEDKSIRLNYTMYF